nr:hypothetical protein CFP56_10295 [Quercus suber]
MYCLAAFARSGSKGGESGCLVDQKFTPMDLELTMTRLINLTLPSPPRLSRLHDQDGRARSSWVALI